MRILIFLLLFPFVAQSQIIRANNYYTTTAVVGCSYLLDLYSGAEAAYSLRKLDVDYVGNAIRVRRSSDNTEQDIGFTGTCGDLDTASFKTFIGAGDGFVVTWYDQSGNGNNVTMATTANQPQLVLNHWGSLPAVLFDGTNDYLEVTGFMGSATAGTMFMVNNISAEPPSPESTSGHPVFASYPSSVNSHYPYTDGTIYEGFGTSARKTTVNPTPSLVDLHIYSAISASADYRTYLNNSNIYSTSTNTVEFYSTFRLGFQGAVYYYKGYLGEVIIYSSALSDSDRNGVSANCNTYYTIY